MNKVKCFLINKKATQQLQELFKVRKKKKKDIVRNNEDCDMVIG